MPNHRKHQAPVPRDIEGMKPNAYVTSLSMVMIFNKRTGKYKTKTKWAHPFKDNITVGAVVDTNGKPTGWVKIQDVTIDPPNKVK